MRDHRKLRAFVCADQLVVDIYRITRGFPREEQFGLTSQMRRCAVSIAANIVEGCARTTQKEYVRFLDIAFGSAREIAYFIDLTRRLGYLDEPGENTLMALQGEVAKTLSGLIRTLQKH